MGRKLVAALAVLAALLLVACGSDSDGGSGGDDTSPITVGLAQSFSGPFEAYDSGIVNMVKLWAKETNADGGIDGRQVEFVESDVASDPAKGPVAAQEVIDKGADVVLVSNDFDIGSSAAITANGAGKLVFAAAGSPKFGVDAIGPLAFTIGTAAENDGYAAAEFAHDSKGWKTVYILLDDTIDYDKSYTRGFKQRWIELAGEDSILGEDTFKNSDASIASQIAKIKSLKEQPDFISLSTYVPGGATAIRQLRAAGIDIPIVASEAMEGSYWLDTVPGLKDFYFGAYASTNGDDSDEDVNRITELYTEEYGEAPTISLSYMGWAMMQVISDAIETTGSTEGEELAKHLETLTDFPTVVGVASYTPERHITAKRAMTIMENSGGKSGFVEKLEPSVEPELQG